MRNGEGCVINSPLGGVHSGTIAVDFDVRYPGRPDDLVQDNVLMKISFVASESATGS